MSVTLVLGTRPEIVKMAPLVRALETRGLPFALLHTGQHYDRALDARFFDELRLPRPDANLAVAPGSPSSQLASMVEGLGARFEAHAPDCVVVQGDTNSTLAGALAARAARRPLVHVEAGLRCGDRRMAEESNRIVVDHLADLLLAPTEAARANLLREGVGAARVEVTGNTSVDALRQHRRWAEAAVPPRPDPYALATLHRAETVDERPRLAAVLDGLRRVARRWPVVLPLHPRTRARIAAFGLSTQGLEVTDPFGPLAFLRRMAEARVVVTDSGGVQEEACALGVPCVTVRTSTERPESVAVGANRLAAPEPGAIEAAAAEADASRRGWPNPYGDGRAAERTLDAMVRHGILPPFAAVVAAGVRE